MYVGLILFISSTSEMYLRLITDGLLQAMLNKTFITQVNFSSEDMNTWIHITANMCLYLWCDEEGEIF